MTDAMGPSGLSVVFHGVTREMSSVVLLAVGSGIARDSGRCSWSNYNADRC